MGGAAFIYFQNFLLRGLYLWIRLKWGLKTTNPNLTMNRIRIFTAKYIPATNLTGSRIRVTDTWNNKSVILPIDSRKTSEIAIEFLNSKGIYVSCDSCEKKTGIEIFGTSNFENQIK
jgi:hypothetical protein